MQTATAGQQVRAATTTGTKDDPADVADQASPPLYGKQAAVVLCLKAKNTARGAAADKPPPRYYRTADRPDTQRNAATFAERKAAEACCCAGMSLLRSSRRREKFRIGSTDTTAQEGSAADRATRVAGSGPKRLSVGPCSTSAPWPNPPTPDLTHSRRGEGRGGAAPVGGRLYITLATTEAAGRGAACPGGGRG